MRSSFGAIVYDSLPCLYVPIGFCAGLEDRDSHLMRFTWRDYDPCIGRFMSLDPANDTRGDGDLYDYCVDDPVNRQDVSGLAWDESKHPRDADGQLSTRGAASRAIQPKCRDSGHQYTEGFTEAMP